MTRVGATGEKNPIVSIASGTYYASGVGVQIQSGASVIVQSGLGVQVTSGAFIVVASGIGVQIQSGAGVQIQSGAGVTLNSGLWLRSGSEVTIYPATLSGLFIASGIGVTEASGLYYASGVGVTVQSGLIILSGVINATWLSGLYLASGQSLVSGQGVIVGITTLSGLFVASGVGVIINSGVGVTVQSGVYLASGIYQASGVGVIINSGVGVTVQSGYGVTIQSGIGVLVSGTYISPELRTSGHVTALFNLTDLVGEQPSFTERWEWLNDLRDRQQIFYRKYCGRSYPYSPIWMTEASGLVSESWTIPQVVDASGTGPYPFANAISMTNSKDGATFNELYIGSKRTFKPPCVMRINARIPDVNGGANGACGSGTYYWFGFENNSQGGDSIATCIIAQSNMYLYMANVVPPGNSSGAIYNRKDVSASNCAIWNMDGGIGNNPLNSVGQNYITLQYPDQFNLYFLDFDPPFLRLWQQSSGSLYPFVMSETKLQKEWGYDNMQAFVANESEVIRSGYAVAQWAVWERTPKGKYTDLLMSGASIGHSGVYLAGSGASGSAVSVDLDCAQFNQMALTYQVSQTSSMIAGTRLYLLGMCDQSGTVVDSENVTDAFAFVEPMFLSGQLTSSCKTFNVDTLPRYLRVLLRNLTVQSAGAYRVYGHFSRGID